MVTVLCFEEPPVCAADTRTNMAAKPAAISQVAVDLMDYLLLLRRVEWLIAAQT
jgi:hypothetical protein